MQEILNSIAHEPVAVLNVPNLKLNALRAAGDMLKAACPYPETMTKHEAGVIVTACLYLIESCNQFQARIMGGTIDFFDPGAVIEEFKKKEQS